MAHTQSVTTAGRRSIRASIQHMGSFLSSMVMPNIGIFIAWGLITAFVIPTGWTPNEFLAKLVEPTIKFLLPLLIAYTGGSKIYGKRGGAIGALATMGVIVGSDVVMLIGGMVMGPLAALALKHVDRLYAGKVKAGLEMLVDNFVLGILGAILMLAGYIAVEPIFSAILGVLSIGVEWLTGHGLLPLLALFVQPGQVLFLNNAINHGIMIPLGIEQALQTGKSILFLVEANGGPWAGLLLAFMVFGKGVARKTAPASFLILFIGGIGEVAFPYVLIKPILILAPVFGQMAGLATLMMLNGGTVGPVSPGSFIALLIMTPAGGFVANIAGYVIAAAVSFGIAALFLRLDRTPEAPDEMEAEPAHPDADLASASAATPVLTAISGPIRRLALICDAGMGSSVMGSAILKGKVTKAALPIEVVHAPIDEMPSDVDAIVTNKVLEERVLAKLGDKKVPVWTLTNFLDNAEYDAIVRQLAERTDVRDA